MCSFHFCEYIYTYKESLFDIHTDTRADFKNYISSPPHLVPQRKERWLIFDNKTFHNVHTFQRGLNGLRLKKVTECKGKNIRPLGIVYSKVLGMTREMTSRFLGKDTQRNLGFRYVFPVTNNLLGIIKAQTCWCGSFS